MKRERERESKATGHLPGRAGPPGPCQSSPTSASRQRRETVHARGATPPPCSPASLPVQPVAEVHHAPKPLYDEDEDPGSPAASPPSPSPSSALAAAVA